MGYSFSCDTLLIILYPHSFNMEPFFPDTHLFLFQICVNKLCCVIVQNLDFHL